MRHQRHGPLKLRSPGCTIPPILIMILNMRLTRCLSPALAAGLGLSLAACGTAATPATTPSSGPSAATETSMAAPSPRPSQEVEKPQPRLAISHEGGILIVDATSLKQLAEFKAEGHLGLNDAGDGRHLLVGDDNGFRVLDMGAWTQSHGDHGHSYTAEPLLTNVSFPGKGAGHAVVHENTVTLFFDETGDYKVYDPRLLNDQAAPKTTDYKTGAPHHGVAMKLHDGARLETIGTDKERVGARVLDSSDKEIAKSEECPGVHGEGAAADHRIVLGCTNGMLIFDGKSFTKMTSPDSYGRIATVAATEKSPIVLGDYKVDKDAKPERSMRVSLVDTTNASMKLVDLPATYAYSSLGRGPAGEALVLGTDGMLRVIDPAAGTITKEVKVTEKWDLSADWKTPVPRLRTIDKMAYVTEPATKKIHVIDMTSWTVTNSGEITQTPNAINGVAG